jgi:hypothetical protein
MAGGLLNIVSVGNSNQILTGNPTKTFFKVVYSKYTNFGLQKFRIDYDGTRDLRLTETSTFSFKMGRYADLLMDTYLCVTLPDIWSPIYHPCFETSYAWQSYEFKWIRDIGTHMIKEITITCGSQLLQKYSGQYLAAMVERDFSADKKGLFNEMTGNISELYDPQNIFSRINKYPNAYTENVDEQVEPSIRGRQLYIPINSWFTMDSRCAFPLISLQYNELYINVTLRPIQELFLVRDVFDSVYKNPYVQPDFNLPQFQMYRFLQSPPGAILSADRYAKYRNQITTWNADIHLVSTYCFLSNEERQLFAMQDQMYLVKDIYEYQFENMVGTKKVSLTSNGLIASWMWYFQRNDVAMRNEWSNYTNWPYRSIPMDIMNTSNYNQSSASNVWVSNEAVSKDIFIGLGSQYSGMYTTENVVGYLNRQIGPGYNPVYPLDYANTNTPLPFSYATGYSINPTFTQDNVYEIMVAMGIVLNGDYRENVFPSGIYNYIEKYARSNSFAKRGLYCYNFCLHTTPTEYQPSGAINMSNFKTIELEISTITPVVDPTYSNFTVICDNNGQPIGTNKSSWRLYDYTFNMTLFEERYNVLTFSGGNCGMLYAR